LCVTPKNFESHLKIVSEFYNPISLKELEKQIKEKNIKNKSIVITFDDGYVDNFDFAMPLLEKYKIPATIFVTTHYVNKNQEPWWDELEKVLPEDPSWDVTKNIFNNYQKKYIELHKKLKPLSMGEKENIVSQLASKNKKSCREDYRIVNSDELKKLNLSKFIEIGSHSVTHPQMSMQNIHEQIYEIKESKKYLEDIIQTSITSFSYPFGTPNDIGPLTPELLEKNGYTVATANSPDFITKNTDPLMLPRHLVRNLTGQEFNNKLKLWFCE